MILVAALLLTACGNRSDEDNSSFAYEATKANERLVEDSLYLNPEFSDNICSMIPEMTVLAANYKNTSKRFKSGSLPPEESIRTAASLLQKGDYAQVAFNLRQAIVQADSMRLPRRSCFPIYYGLALTYIVLHDFEQADFYLQMAGQYVNRMTPREKYIYMSYVGLNDMYRTDYSKAIRRQQEAYQIASGKADMQYESNIALATMGQIFLKNGKADSALVCLEKSFRYLDSTRVFPSAIYYVQSLRMSTALKRNQMEAATSIIYRNNPGIEPVLTQQRSSMLIDYYIQINDWRDAYWSLHRDKLRNDSILNERLHTRIAELNLHYQQDTTLLNQQMTKQHHSAGVTSVAQKAIIVGLLIIMAALILFFLILYSRIKHNYKLANQKSKIQAIRMIVTQNCVPADLVEKATGSEETEHGIVPVMGQVLTEADRLSCSLENELSLVRNYLSLAAKVDSSLTVNYEIDDTIKQDEILVPLRIIQIIVANSVDVRLKAVQNQKVLNLSIQPEGINTIIKVVDNGGGHVVHQSDGQKGIDAMLKIVELFNKCNKNEIEIAFHTVWLRNGEKGCETKIVLPKDYTFEL